MTISDAGIEPENAAETMLEPCGTLMIESAGTQGQLIISSVPDVEDIQREIYRLHDQDDERRRNKPTGS